MRLCGSDVIAKPACVMPRRLSSSPSTSAAASVLPIAPSTYYAQVTKRTDPEKLSARAKRDKALKADIRRVFAENFAVYGVRKVWRQLRREGLGVALGEARYLCGDAINHHVRHPGRGTTFWIK
jgi:hypothetical protein